MGRFNLNQILSDTSKAAAGGGSAKPRPSESRYEKLSVFDLVPSEDNSKPLTVPHEVNSWYVAKVL